MTAQRHQQQRRDDDDGHVYTLKFVLVGDSSVGKSQLVSRFSKNLFLPETSSTVGMEFATRELVYYGGARLKAQVWDTAGQERFHSLTQAYYRGAVGALLVYDVTSRASFDGARRWLRQIRDNAHRNIAVSLVGNKSDRGGGALRAVTTAEGVAFAEAHGMDFVETSAATGENVETAFRRLIMAVARLLPEGKRRAAAAAAEADAAAAAATAAAAAVAGGTAANTPQKSTSGNSKDPGDNDNGNDDDSESESGSSALLLPEGWVRVASKLRDGAWSYENIWTGERVTSRPRAPAVEHNTIAARALSNSVDMAGVGLKDAGGDGGALPPHVVGTTCGNLGGGNCAVM